MPWSNVAHFKRAHFPIWELYLSHLKNGKRARCITNSLIKANKNNFTMSHSVMDKSAGTRAELL